MCWSVACLCVRSSAKCVGITRIFWTGRCDVILCDLSSGVRVQQYKERSKRYLYPECDMHNRHSDMCWEEGRKLFCCSAAISCADRFATDSFRLLVNAVIDTLMCGRMQGRSSAAAAWCACEWHGEHGSLPTSSRTCAAASPDHLWSVIMSRARGESSVQSSWRE